MSIRARLFLLISGSLLLIGGAIGVYFLITAPVNQLADEERLIATLVQNTTILEAEINKFMIEALVPQKKRFEDAKARYDQAFDEFSKVKIIPTINEEMAGAVSAVLKLKDFNEGQITRVADGVESVLSDAKLILVGVDQATTLAFFKSAAEGDKQNEIIAIRAHIGDLALSIQSLNSGIDIMTKAIGQKDALITTTVAAIRAQSSLVALIILVVIILLAIVFSILLARSISGSIRKLQTFIGQVALGDFSRRYNSRARDEIAKLASHLDGLLDNLSVSIGAIQNASKQNLALRDELLFSVERATSSSTEIAANSESIRTQMERMDGMVGESSKQGDTVLGVVKGFAKKVSTQNEHIAESVSAVTQMLASLENLARNTTTNQEATESLVIEADHGRDVFDQSFEKINEITESMTAIEDMASVIAGIAGQTNILAMNAAIEAAHAGEFGKGFAVVADEISKLASASAESSENIAQTIRDVTERIAEASAIRGVTTEAFEVIREKIKVVSQSVTEITSSISEMQTGNRQILQAMQELRSNSESINREGIDLERLMESVRRTIGEIGRISHEVVSNIGEISKGLEEITSSVLDVSENAEKIGNVGAKLDGEASKFVLTRDEGLEESELEVADSGEKALVEPIA